ncbi:helix-turn-helix domain-containing protein [Flavobacterium sp. ov086]|uniref:helix-turn-helix domain-containing protein n=1 Tax=Flavobacterium sp. ov086 TaxID=1761785 RepID=UPI000B62964A|nr:helix-turn-helix domain-containing protein [Flavobacterium sp. ov086]SNR71957.1 DNA binding domain-containing protein, excisionase family [Flavobacterium sp. ov086]
MLQNQIILNGITIEQLAEALAPLLQSTISQSQQALPENITRKQACTILNIGLATLWKHTKEGKLTSYGIGNRIMYKRDEVLQALKPLNI